MAGRVKEGYVKYNQPIAAYYPSAKIMGPGKGTFYCCGTALKGAIDAASFVVIGVFLIVHLYMYALPMNRKSLNTMFGDGRLSMDCVKSYHYIWYEKLTGKSDESP